MTAIMLRGGHVYSPADPFATAMLIIDGVIRWIGSDTGADTHLDAADQVWDLRGALVTPAFVDAHVHATATGLMATGIDLSGCQSADEVLRRLRAAADNHGGSGVLWGHGWDETTWADGRLPTRASIDEVVGHRPVYLSRIDVHSAVVSSALIELMIADDRSQPPVDTWEGFDSDGPLTKHAHAVARRVAFASLSSTQRREAQSWTLGQAARKGIASIHEMAGPTISSADDLRALMLQAGDSPTESMVEVVAYWGELLAIDLARDLGAVGCAGDLFVDGSIGSHTAALRYPYHDAPDTTGDPYLSVDQVAEHVVACTQAGLQAGFHVIGDAAMDRVIAGFAAAENHCDHNALRRSRHRLEHAEFLHPEHIVALDRWSIVASMQPAFDAAWGGDDKMYARRLGEERALALNPFAALSQEGVCLAWGSDAPVTPLDPWGSVQAAAFHHNHEQRISVRASFAAHTRGGRRAAAQEHIEPGVLREETPATLAIWAPGELVVQAPDARIAAWSTDERSGTPGLPDLTPGKPLPQCWLTMRHGRILHDDGAIARLV